LAATALVSFTVGGSNLALGGSGGKDGTDDDGLHEMPLNVIVTPKQTAKHLELAPATLVIIRFGLRSMLKVA
jgi:hypothetical protein